MDTRKIKSQLKRAEKAARLAEAEIGILAGMLNKHADFDLIVTDLKGDGLAVMDDSGSVPVGASVESVITQLKETGQILLSDLITFG